MRMVNAKMELIKPNIFKTVTVLLPLVWSSVRVSRARRWSISEGNETRAINRHKLGSFARNSERAESRPS